MPYTPGSMWEFVFMMVLLKLPIAYLAWVVYWAVKAEPPPPEPALRTVPAEPEPLAPHPHPRAPRPRRVSPRPSGHGNRGGRRSARARAGVAR